MMKSFFKKLAFVMALAMVVTMAAPAAAKAYAADMYLAYQNGGAVTELNMKVGSEEDLCFKKAPANWAELSKKWSSNNEAVAIVDKNGVVTAIGNGTATITFELGDGTAASVAVNVGEAKVYDVTLGNAEDKAMKAVELKTGATLDLNFYGVKDWSVKKYSYTWISNAPEVAKVDQKGVVTAVAAGTATVTLALVNNETGATMNVTPVVVTVPEEKKADAFTVAQVNSDTVKLTFEAKQDVTVDNLGFAMLIGDVYVTVPVKAVAVNENVATVTLFNKVSDGQAYRFTFGENVVDFTASAGAVDHVVFTYYTGEDASKNVGVAYVSTEAEPCEVNLVPVLYDANNVDVTSNYDLDNFTIEFETATESEAYEMTSGETICFEDVAAAIVTLSVSWTDDESGEDIVKTFTSPIVAQKRPDLKHTVKASGFMPYGWRVTPADAAEDFRTNKDSFMWNNSWCYQNTWTYGDWEAGLQFAALVTDNRGNTVASGVTDYPYGYFTYTSSNDDVLDITADGDITIIGEGTATVLIYFVDTTGEEDVTTFIGAQKITVYPERYAATYKIGSTSATAITAGSTSGKFKLTVYDQYGAVDREYLANSVADITVEASSETNTVTELDVVWNSGSKCYEIKYNGADFAEMVGDASSKTFKYKVTVDKEANEKITTSATATLTLKVVNTNSAYAKLDEFLNPTEVGEGETAPEAATKFYYKTSQNKSSVDVYVNQVANFMNEDDARKATTKSANVSVSYLTANNGYTLASVPKDNIVALEEKQTTGDAGIVYYTVEAPKDAANYGYVVKNGKIEFTFNSEADGFGYATNGDYKVTLKTASKDAGSLKTLATYTIAVTNSQPEVTFDKYDNDNGNKTTVAITEGMTWDNDSATIINLIKSNLEFKYNGASLDMDTANIWYVEFKALDGKIRIDKVTFGVPVNDGDDSTYYYYQSKPSVKKWIYTEE